MFKPDCSDGGDTLFLAGADHGRCEKEKWSRQLFSFAVVRQLCSIYFCKLLHFSIPCRDFFCNRQKLTIFNRIHLIA